MLGTWRERVHVHGQAKMTLAINKSYQEQTTRKPLVSLWPKDNFLDVCIRKQGQITLDLK